MPDLGRRPHPPMADIKVQVGGVAKLLRNINPHNDINITLSLRC